MGEGGRVGGAREISGDWGGEGDEEQREDCGRGLVEIGVGGDGRRER